MITIFKFLLVVMYVVCSLSLIFVVLLQQGKGAGMGASLGGGASQTLFGSRAPTFMSRFTGVLAAVFFLGAIALAKWPPFTPANAVDADGILQIEEVAPATPEATPDVEVTEPDQTAPAAEEAASAETQVPVEVTTPEAPAPEATTPAASPDTTAVPADAPSAEAAVDAAVDQAATAATPDQGQ